MDKTVFDGQLWEAHIAWLAHCTKNNILDPFEALENLKNEYIEYKKIAPGETQIIIYDKTKEQENRLKELEKYRDEYIQDREFFTGQFLLKHYGYDELSSFAQSHSSKDYIKLQEWFQTIKPCEGKDGQCQIFCPIFQECNNKN